MRKTKLKIMVTVAGAAVVCGSLLAVQGTSSAETETGFRLSNFVPFSGISLCMETDLQKDVCLSGGLFGNRSEVFTVKYNDPNSFRCVATETEASSVTSDVPFSRNEFKECKVTGPSIQLVRPDGSVR